MYFVLLFLLLFFLNFFYIVPLNLTSEHSDFARTETVFTVINHIRLQKCFQRKKFAKNIANFKHLFLGEL